MPKIVVDTDELYEINVASSLIGIGYATVYRWIKRGKLFVVKVGGRTLVPKSEIERIKNKTPVA